MNKNKITQFIYAPIITCLVFIFFNSCKKDEVIPSNSTKTILKYEIISSVPFAVLPTSNFSLSVSYTNATGQTQVEQSIITGTTWTKTVELTSSQRPINILAGGSGFTNGISGSVTINIYENDLLKATNVGTISSSGLQGYGIAYIPTIFYLKQ
jgi:hypothetical protein